MVILHSQVSKRPNKDKAAMAAGTTRKQLIQESEVKYRRLFEAAQDGILILDADTGQITDVNPFLTDMLGYSREELVGKELWEIGPFKDIEASREAFRELQSQGYVRYENLPLENKSGQRMSVEFVSNVYMVDSQRVIQCNIRDITKRKQAEHALKYSEVKYRRLFEAAQDGILILDADTGKITDVNPFLTDMLGYPREELLGKELWEIGPFKDIEASRGAFKELQSQGYVRYENLPLQNKSGQRKSVEFVSNVYMVNSQRVIQCNIRDITERKMAEEKQQAIIKTALDGFWICNLEGKFLEVNESYSKMTGYTREELLEMSIQDIEAVESPEETARRIKRIVAQGSDRFETQHKRKDGKIIDIEISVNYFNIGEGQLFVFVHDITERKRAGEAMQVSEIRYRRLFEAARDGILILNAETGQIVDVNPFLVEMLGFTYKEFLGRKIWELGLLKDIIANKDNFVELQRKGYVRYEGLPLETTAGQRLEVEFVSNVYEVDHQKCNPV